MYSKNQCKLHKDAILYVISMKQNSIKIERELKVKRSLHKIPVIDELIKIFLIIP